MRLSSEELKVILTAQIGERAKIEKLEVLGQGDKIAIEAVLDDGFGVGKVKLAGKFRNTASGLEAQNLNIEARRYEKSRIEGRLSDIPERIQKYFEQKNNRRVSRISIEGGELKVEFA